jgi:peptidyl-prolyl cis-trans isomerase D
MITMMRRYRKALQVGLLLVIAAFVASLFVFGAGGIGGGPETRDAVATVNGEPISTERYQRRYQVFLASYAQMLRDRFSPEMAERFGLPQQVVEDLVQEALVVQRARREGLEVTDEELNAQVHAIKAFQEGARFSLKRYQEVLRRNGLTEAAFERDFRAQLTRQKLEQAVRAGVKVSDAEVEQAYAQRREEVRALWALVETAPLIGEITPTDAELEAYLKEHAAQFREPERRRIESVAFNPADFITPVPDAEVQKYYDEHAAEFETPHQVQVSHILVRVPETGGSEAEDRAREKTADIIKRIKAGEAFDKLARELSEDPGSADKGGDLGFVGKGEMVPQFEAAVFGLKKGEMTPEPVRTPFGYHAILARDIREGTRKPFKEVAAEIRARLALEAADRAARARADEVRPPLQAAADFMAEARKLGLTPSTATIPRRPPAPGAPEDPVSETAFGLTLGGISVPIKTPAGWMIVKNVAELPAAVPPLAEIRARVVAAVKRQKADAVALTRAQDLVKEAPGGDFAAAAKKVSAVSGETKLFSRTRPAERLPGDAQVAALRTAVGALTEPVKTAQGYYVLKVLERVPADMKDLPQERDKLRSELLAQKQSEAWQSWIAAARAGATIERQTPPPPRRT